MRNAGETDNLQISSTGWIECHRIEGLVDSIIRIGAVNGVSVHLSHVGR